VRYAFVAEHRGQFSIQAMCRCLRIQPSGFYAWLQAPMSQRVQEDKRQTKMLLNAWTDSGKVYVDLSRFGAAPLITQQRR
jgi:putative transposase